MRKSKIFTNKRLEAIEERLKGNKKDDLGTFAKTKQVIEEIVNVWFPRKKELESLIGK